MAVRHLNSRDAQALVNIACSLEDRANRLKERDPETFSRQGLDGLHRAARIIGDCGRQLRAAKSDSQS